MAADNTFSAGRLRHRVDIEKNVQVQDTNGEMADNWQPYLMNVAAEIAPYSAREYVAALAIQSSVNTKITIRFRPNITADMRIVHRPKGGDETIYNIVKPIRDPDTGLEWLLILASDGVNDG